MISLIFYIEISPSTLSSPTTISSSNLLDFFSLSIYSEPNTSSFLFNISPVLYRNYAKPPIYLFNYSIYNDKDALPAQVPFSEEGLTILPAGRFSIIQDFCKLEFGELSQ